MLDALTNATDSEGNSLGLEENTIIVFTADHGEYGGSHGLRNKGFAAYEEAIHVPLYVYDPTGTIIPEGQRGTTRDQFTSHVDLLPLLMSLASGDNAWRQEEQYAHLAGRADLFAMLSNPDAEGRDYILSTSDEDYPEFLGKSDKIDPELVAILEQYAPRPPGHVIGYRTPTAKLGVYSYFADCSIDIVMGETQQAELYNYEQDGFDEVINRSPSGPAPDPALYQTLYDALFDPNSGAVANELRQPLPDYLQAVQTRAINNYVVFQATNQSDPLMPQSCGSEVYLPLVEK